ncbi:MAG: FkbM family methyltransferase [Bacteroidota bacterium]|nr:FkbM family methyltransferase [Bacteroidota bacterium]
MNLIEKINNKFCDKAYSSQKISYSQSGEDLIVDFLLTWVLGIKEPSYIDIGAHHAYKFNNNFIFYKRGLTGIDIEPDPILFADIAKKRPKDININKGIGSNIKNEYADFYIMSSRTLNTFSKMEAERISEEGINKIVEIKSIELININDILCKYYSENALDFLSIDVEGLDLEILRSIDFEKYGPKVICVETIIFTSDRIFKKQQSTIDFLLENGYACYADTSINSIFVRRCCLDF